MMSSTYVHWLVLSKFFLVNFHNNFWEIARDEWFPIYVYIKRDENNENYI